MNCPKCGCKIPNNCDKCRVCGMVIDTVMQSIQNSNNTQYTGCNNMETIQVGNYNSPSMNPGGGFDNFGVNQRGGNMSDIGGHNAGYTYSEDNRYGVPNTRNYGYGNTSYKSLTSYQVIKLFGAFILLIGSFMPFIPGLNVIQCCISSVDAVNYSDVYAGTGFQGMYLLFSISMMVQPITLYGVVLAIILAVLRTGKPAYKSDVAAVKFILMLELIIALMPLFMITYLSAEYGSSVSYDFTVGKMFVFAGIAMSYIGCKKE